MQGRLCDDYIGEALDIRSWEAAQEHVRDWEAKGSMVADVKRVIRMTLTVERESDALGYIRVRYLCVTRAGESGVASAAVSISSACF